MVTMSNAESNRILLRAVTEEDVVIFFRQQLDEEANRMAAFTAQDPADREAFTAHWARILSDDTIIKKTILFKGDVAGHVVCFEHFGQPSVSYWLDKKLWGQGIATNALQLFLNELQNRPIYARVAKDNLGSLRVLEKCGFTIMGEDKGFSNARDTEVEEFILMLTTGL